MPSGLKAEVIKWNGICNKTNINGGLKKMKWITPNKLNERQLADLAYIISLVSILLSFISILLSIQ